jgi:hypothetical protein
MCLTHWFAYFIILDAHLLQMQISCMKIMLQMYHTAQSQK